MPSFSKAFCDRLVVLLFALSLSILSFAQHGYTDSLHIVLNEEKDPENYLKTAYLLASWYIANGDFAYAETISRQIGNSELRKNAQLLTVAAYSLLTVISAEEEDYETGKIRSDSTFLFAQKTNDTSSMVWAAYAKGELQYKLYDAAGALRTLLDAKNLIKHPDRKAALSAEINYLLYKIYNDWGNKEKALEYGRTSAAYAGKTMNRNLQAKALSALAEVFNEWYKTNKSDFFRDSSAIYIDSAISLNSHYRGQVVPNIYSGLLVKKAGYLLEYLYLPDQSERLQIENDVKEALRISQSLDNNDYAFAEGYIILSRLKAQENNPEEAETLLLQAYSLLWTKDEPEYTAVISVLKELVNFYKKNNNYKEANKFQKEILHYRNLLFDERAASTSKRLEAKYEFQSKEEQIGILKKAAEAEKKRKDLFLGLIGIGIAGVFFMFRSYHFRLKYSMTRERQLEAEKEEAISRIQLEKEERARVRAEQKILSLKQQKLNDQMMTNRLQLEHKNEILKDLKKKVPGKKNFNIKQLLREETVADDSFEKAKLRIQKISPDFYVELNKRSRKNLTALDQKYCSYFYLNMSVKEVADLLNVAPKSVRMTKYRLKKKLGLNTDDDLLEFLKSIG